MTSDASATAAAVTTAQSKTKILIIGAGAAGLQCAYSLVTEHDQNDFVILDARDRVGGRIHTWKRQSRNTETEEDDTSSCARFPNVVDMGAAWVHGTEPYPVPNPMLKYIPSTSLQPIAPGNPWMRPCTVMHKGLSGADANDIKEERRLLFLYHKGQRLDTDDTIIEKALDRHFHLMYNLVPQKAQDLYNAGMGLKTAELSLKDTINELKADFLDDADERIQALTDFYLYLMTAWYGKSPSELQLSNFTADGEELPGNDNDCPPDWSYREEGDFRGPHCLVVGGMERLLQPLLERVGDKVNLHTQVEEIWQEGNLVHARCKSGAVYQAEACVLTIPINCLRQDASKIFRRTKLSEAKMEAMKYISMGDYKKVMLVFDRIFWPVDPPFLGLVRCQDNNKTDDSIGPSLLVDNLWARDGLACFEVILAGDAARWATNRPDPEVRDAVLDFVRESFDVDQSDLSTWCMDCHVTRWEEDPFSRGAYASLSLGALPRHMDAMMEPEWGGALVFAGDAFTHDFEGGVHAALLSGTAAASSVNEFLSKEGGKGR